MDAVSVIPITRAITKEELTYYTNLSVSPGDVVTIPLRRKEIPALVTDVKSVKAKKASLRSASFSVRKIVHLQTKSFLLPSFMAAVERSAEYFASTTGATLNTLIPKNILTQEHIQTETPPAENTTFEIYVLQDESEERLAYYKSLARELFAKNKSLFIVLPTRESAEQNYKKLGKGIEQHTVLLHSGLTKKKMEASWQDALTNTHPVLVVATSHFLSLPRKDIGTIVIEEEHSRYYKASNRPYTDYRTFGIFLAEEMNVPVVLSDRLVRLETLYELKKNSYTSIGRPKMRTSLSTRTEIIDMRKYSKSSEYGFRTISNELHELLENIKKNEHCFVFTLRKGLYPMTICGDCGHLVRCTKCEFPVVVHSGKPNRFVCHKCNLARSTEERCAKCKSWNLVPLGTGSQRIAKEISELLPDKRVFLVNPDEMTPKQIGKIIEKWYKTPSSVLVGTEVVLQFLQKTAYIAIASIDTLFTLPDFRADERIMQTLINLREKTEKTFLVQTRSPEQRIFGYITNPNISKWSQEELKDRKTLNYPPFSTLIKITTSGSEKNLKEHIELLEKNLGHYKPYTFPAFTPKVRGKNVVHTLISIPRESWPDKKLSEILKDLQPKHTVQVDPEHLL